MMVRSASGVALHYRYYPTGLRGLLLLLFLLAGAFLALLPGRVHAQNQPLEKYSMQQRFGVAGRPAHFDQVPGHTYYDLGIGWYHTWEYGEKHGHLEELGPRPDHSLSFVGVVGGWAHPYPVNNNDAPCVRLRTMVKENPHLYPDRMFWVVGNELGLDDLSRINSVEEHAIEFIRWRSCLKSIKSTFRVGSGAIVVDLKLPAIASNLCASPEHRSAGRSGIVESDGVRRYAATAYFELMMEAIAKQNKAYLPDFVTFHPYLVCDREGMSDAEHFKQMILEMRTAMKAVGMRDRDLFATEFAHTSKDINETIQRMEEYVDILVNYRDNRLGQPGDSGRMVQRWAWYLVYFWDANDPRWEQAASLYEPGSFPTPRLSPVGRKYQELIARYVNSNTCVIQGGIQTANASLAKELDKIKVTVTGAKPVSSTGTTYVFVVPGNRRYRVTIDTPQPVKAFSTACANRVDCHSSRDKSRTNGKRSDSLYCPTNGYVDIWWDIWK